MLARSSDQPHIAREDLDACKALLRAGSKSFAAASLLLPKRVRDPAAALYAFCRTADDAVDLARDPGAVAVLYDRIERAYAGTPLDSPVDRAFSRVVLDYAVPRALVEAHVEGFAWDAEGRRFSTLSELTAYAARVAGAVGAMMTVLMGARTPEALARACDLGVAMQLTNIARDIGEDARAGRIYVPLTWLDEVGIEPASLLARPAPSAQLLRLTQRLLEHADNLYTRSERGIALLPRDCQAAIRAARLIYADIGREIARHGYDSISTRAHVSGPRKAWLALVAMLVRGRGERAEGDPPALAETQFLVDAACPALPA